MRSKHKIRILKTTTMKNYLFPIILEKDDYGYFVSCPSLQGCYTQGKTYEEALENIRDAIKLHLEDRAEEEDEDVLPPRPVSLTTVEVAV